MPKYVNACLVLRSHPETLRPLARPPLEETELRAEATEVEVAATLLQETARPILLPTSHLRGPFTNQPNCSIPAMNKDRRALSAQDPLLPETNSLSANPEALKGVVDSASLLAVPDQVHELALALGHVKQQLFWSCYD